MQGGQRRTQPGVQSGRGFTSQLVAVLVCFVFVCARFGAGLRVLNTTHNYLYAEITTLADWFFEKVEHYGKY